MKEYDKSLKDVLYFLLLFSPRKEIMLQQIHRCEEEKSRKTAKTLYLAWTRLVTFTTPFLSGCMDR